MSLDCNHSHALLMCPITGSGQGRHLPRFSSSFSSRASSPPVISSCLLFSNSNRDTLESMRARLGWNSSGDKNDFSRLWRTLKGSGRDERLKDRNRLWRTLAEFILVSMPMPKFSREHFVGNISHLHGFFLQNND